MSDCWHFTQKATELEYVETKQLFYLKFLHKLEIVFIVESSHLAPFFLWRGFLVHAASRTLLPGELRSLPVGHRRWHRMSHTACGECNSRRSWHWFPLDILLPKVPFLSGDPSSWQEVAYMLPTWRWKQKHCQSQKLRGQTSVCFGCRGLF